MNVAMEQNSTTQYTFLSKSQYQSSE